MSSHRCLLLFSLKDSDKQNIHIATLEVIKYTVKEKKKKKEKEVRPLPRRPFTAARRHFLRMF